MADSSNPATKQVYNRFLLLVAGLSGLLYGIDVGIIGGALPYLEATSKLTGAQLSIIVAAVLLGSMFSTLFAGMLSDLIGRKPMMVIGGTVFVLSIPVIALSQGYGALFLGRAAARDQRRIRRRRGSTLSGGVPAGEHSRKGHGRFSVAVDSGHCVRGGDRHLFQLPGGGGRASLLSRGCICTVKSQAWRRIFLMCMPAGVVFAVSSLFVAESPRCWLYRRGRKKRNLALAALLRSHNEEQAQIELREMDQLALSGDRGAATASGSKPSLLSRQYVIPFLLACVILFCSTATGV